MLSTLVFGLLLVAFSLAFPVAIVWFVLCFWDIFIPGPGRSIGCWPASTVRRRSPCAHVWAQPIAEIFG